MYNIMCSCSSARTNYYVHAALVSNCISVQFKVKVPAVKCTDASCCILVNAPVCHVTLPSWQVVQFHPNGKYIATGSSDRTCRLWDVQSGQCVRLLPGSKVGPWPGVWYGRPQDRFLFISLLSFSLRMSLTQLCSRQMESTWRLEVMFV